MANDFKFGNKKIQEMYFGDTPVVAVYFGDKLIWSKEQMGFRYIDLNAYGGNSSPAFFITPTESGTLNTITIYIKNNNSQFNKFQLCRYDGTDLINLDSTKCYVLADQNRFNHSAELCDFTTIDDEPIYKVTFTIKSEYTLVLSENVNYYFAISFQNDYGKIAYDNRVSNPSARCIDSNTIPQYQPGYYWPDNISDTTAIGQITCQLNMSPLDWGSDTNAPFSLLEYNDTIEHWTYDDINKTLTWNHCAYYPVGTTNNLVNINYDIDYWYFYGSSRHYTTNTIDISAVPTWNGQVENEASLILHAVNETKTYPTQGGSTSHDWIFYWPENGRMLDTYNYASITPNNNDLACILFEPTETCKFVSIETLHTYSGFNNDVQKCYIWELTHISGDVYSRNVKGEVPKMSGTTYKGGSLSRVVTDMYDSTQTKDTKIYKTYFEYTNSTDLILEAGKLYGISIWDNEWYIPNNECKNFMYKTTQSAQSTNHYRTGFYPSQSNVTTTYVQTYANIVTASTATT